MFTSPELGHQPNPDTSIRQAILATKDGRIPYSEFVRLSLYGDDGYYSRGKVRIGNAAEDDFRTEAESTVLGEEIAAALLTVWEDMDRPATFQVTELASGLAGLAEQFLDGAQKLNPAFYDSVRYISLDIGDHIHTQPARLHNHQAKISYVQANSLEIPLADASVNGAVISNELFDALPFEIIRREDGKNQQMYVQLGDDNNIMPIWAEPSAQLLEQLETEGYMPEEGELTIISPQASKLASEADRILARGVQIHVDYGEAGPTTGNALNEVVRVYSRGKAAFDAQFSRPGEVDITANVNFAGLKKFFDELGYNSGVFFQTDLARFRLMQLISLSHEIFGHSSWEDIVMQYQQLDPSELMKRVRTTDRESILNLGVSSALKALIGVKNMSANILEETDASSFLKELEAVNQAFPLVLGNPGDVITVKVYGQNSNIPAYLEDDACWSSKAYTLNEDGRIEHRKTPLFLRSQFAFINPQLLKRFDEIDMISELWSLGPRKHLVSTNVDFALDMFSYSQRNGSFELAFYTSDNQLVGVIAINQAELPHIYDYASSLSK